MSIANPLSKERGAGLPSLALKPVILAHQLSLPKPLQRSLTTDGCVLLQGPPSPDQLLEQCCRMAPCVLIADLAFVESTADDRLADLTDYGRSVQLLVYDCPPDAVRRRELLRRGCFGFLDPGVSPATLRKAVSAAVRGEMWAGRTILTSLVQDLLGAERKPKLTPRETEILELMAAGSSNRQIAEQLSISPETVRWHVRSLHSKIHLSDRLTTMLYARRVLRQASDGNGM